MTEKKQGTLLVPAIGACLTGLLYCAAHLLNDWLFKAFEVSGHINLVYLPAFIRLASVLILGLVWGTVGTAIGGLLLLYWSQDANVWIALANIGVSASVAAVSVLVLQQLVKRRLSVARLADLLQLSVLYALLNALIHHLLWSAVDPAQLMYPTQILHMVLGDIHGVVIGALLLRWIAHKTKLTQRLRNQTMD